jgi:hypothetical protein
MLFIAHARNEIKEGVWGLGGENSLKYPKIT